MSRSDHFDDVLERIAEALGGSVLPPFDADDEIELLVPGIGGGDEPTAIMTLDENAPDGFHVRSDAGEDPWDLRCVIRMRLETFCLHDALPRDGLKTFEESEVTDAADEPEPAVAPAEAFEPPCEPDKPEAAGSGLASTEWPAKDFVPWKFDWLEQVAVDRDLLSASINAAVLIATRFLNRKTGEAWPSQATLGRLLGVDERRVRDLLNDLCKRGHLAKRRGGSGQPNRYRLIRNPANQTGARTADLPEAQTGARTAGQGGSTDRRNTRQQTGGGTAGKPLEEPIEEEGGAPTALPPTLRTLH